MIAFTCICEKRITRTSLLASGFPAGLLARECHLAHDFVELVLDGLLHLVAARGLVVEGAVVEHGEVDVLGVAADVVRHAQRGALAVDAVFEDHPRAVELRVVVAAHVAANGAEELEVRDEDALAVEVEVDADAVLAAVVFALEGTCGGFLDGVLRGCLYRVLWGLYRVF